MFCPNCGKEQEGSPPYCYNCGVKLALDSSSEPLTLYRNIVEYAGFWKRFAASLIDGILLNIVVWGISLITILISGASIFEESVSPPNTGLYLYSNTTYYIFTSTFLLIFSLVTIGISWIYHALMESSSRQSTVGKMVLGIIVTDSKSKRISFSRATARFFSKYISMLILFIGYMMIAFTEKKQGLHDIIAETLVVKK